MRVTASWRHRLHGSMLELLESGLRVVLVVPILTLFSVSPASKRQGTEKCETPSNSKLTQLGKSHQLGGNRPDVEITLHRLPARARMSKDRMGNYKWLL